MTIKKRIKKALPFVGLVACASLGTTLATIQKSNENTTSVLNQSMTTNTASTPRSAGFVPGSHIAIDGWFVGLMENLSTINGQEIVDAINSFEEGVYDHNNQNNAFNFSYYQGEDATTALLKEIQENIKFLKNNDYTQVYDIPTNVISIIKRNNYNLFNVSIDVSKLDGKIVYFKSFNPSINISQPEGIVPMNRQEVSRIEFNAISYTNIDMPILEGTKSVQSVNIIYIILGCVSALLVILLMVLWFRKRNAGKYIY